MLNLFRLKVKNSNLDKIYIKGNEIAQTKHYVPADKEWFNSIYAYNKNTVKLLPIADKVTHKLLKSYFNSYNLELEKNTRLPYLRRRLKRLSTNRMLISRAELRHTSDKVIVTVYIYNRQRIYFIRKLKELYTLANVEHHAKKIKCFFIKGKIKRFLLKKTIIKRKLFKYDFFNKFNNKLKYFKKAIINYRMKLNMKYITRCRNVQRLLRKKEKLGTITKNLSVLLNNRYNKLYNYSYDPIKNYYISKKLRSPNHEGFLFYHNFINTRLNKYIKLYTLKFFYEELLYMHHKEIIRLNENKFNKSYLVHLENLLGNVYKKKIEFNLVNLKYLYLNSYIFSETIVTKIRKKKNRLLRVLKASLRMFHLAPIDKLSILTDMDNKNKLLQNLKVKYLDPFILQTKEKIKNGINKNPDILYKKKSLDPANSNIHTINTTKNILDSIKHKSVTGIRIEAAGRLTRRNTAAKSIFKLKYKGNLKNIDSSYKGLSTTVLRGHAKSNVQYTKLKSKLRIGSFGIKGWVSSN